MKEQLSVLEGEKRDLIETFVATEKIFYNDILEFVKNFEVPNQQSINAVIREDGSNG